MITLRRREVLKIVREALAEGQHVAARYVEAPDERYPDSDTLVGLLELSVAGRVIGRVASVPARVAVALRFVNGASE